MSDATPPDNDHIPRGTKRSEGTIQRANLRSRRTARTLRWILLLAVLAASTILGLLHSARSASFWPVGVDALCPFGGVEAFWSLISIGAYIKKIEIGSVVLLIATIVLLLIFGRAFCGRICPMGTLQEIFGRVGARLFPKRRAMPRWLDRPARLLKYGVLGVFTLWTWRAGELVMRPFDPWATYHHLTSSELLTDFTVGLAILVVSLLGSLVYDRFFCRYACPMGAFLGIGAKLSWFKVRRSAETCIDCNACNKACPVAVEVASVDTVTSSECISCGECVEACPVKNTLVISDRRGFKFPSLMVTALSFMVFFGIIGLATAADSFNWSKATLAQEVQRAGSQGGSLDTTAIKGWMSVDDVASATGLAAEDIAAPFGIDESDWGTGLGELKSVYGFEMYEMREHVSVLSETGRGF